MNRTAGHALRRSSDRERVGTQVRSCWICECGQQFGPLSVHAARRAWGEHKASLNGHAAPTENGQ